MSQPLLELERTDPGLCFGGGEGVPQRVRCDPFRDARLVTLCVQHIPLAPRVGSSLSLCLTSCGRNETVLAFIATFAIVSARHLGPVAITAQTYVPDMDPGYVSMAGSCSRRTSHWDDAKAQQDAPVPT